MLRIYAAYGLNLSMVRTGHAVSTLAKAASIARHMSISHSSVEIRELTSRGQEVLREIFVAGEPIAH